MCSVARERLLSVRYYYLCSILRPLDFLCIPTRAPDFQSSRNQANGVRDTCMQKLRMKNIFESFHFYENRDPMRIVWRRQIGDHNPPSLTLFDPIRSPIPDARSEIRDPRSKRKFKLVDFQNP